MWMVLCLTTLPECRPLKHSKSSSLQTRGPFHQGFTHHPTDFFFFVRVLSQPQDNPVPKKSALVLSMVGPIDHDLRHGRQQARGNIYPNISVEIFLPPVSTPHLLHRDSMWPTQDQDFNVLVINHLDETHVLPNLVDATDSNEDGH